MRSSIVFGVLSVAVVSSFIWGCDEQSNMINMTQVEQFQDGIPHLIPGVRSIHTLQLNDAKTVSIIVGAPSFYDAPDEKKQQVAIRTGMMVLHVLGAGNYLTSGTLAFTKKDSDEKKFPDDAIKVDMKLDSLNKVMYPAKK